MTFGGQRDSILSMVRGALFGRPAAPMAAASAREQDLVAEFRVKLPADGATARAIDRGAPWEIIAKCAVEDGYVEFADKFSRLVEKRLRRDA